MLDLRAELHFDQTTLVADDYVYCAIAVRLWFHDIVPGPNGDRVTRISGLDALDFLQASQDGTAAPDVVHPTKVHARFTTELVDDGGNTFQPLRDLDMTATHCLDTGPQSVRRSAKGTSMRRAPRFQRVQCSEDLLGADPPSKRRH
ncbi:hypothetical protein AWC22_09610 [Mycobacterium riyadhense]|uniref:Uncharacterized protein n=1 Tax=Mycobacterium riyadhense TaxID=486698 RepID=A0A1X2DGF3_9MYCO|nr:hypothetical protein AWC22_09610 [Mycobacterium riyadhense]